MPAADMPIVPARLLVLDRQRDLADIVAARPDAFALTHVLDGRSGVAALATQAYDIVLADLESLSDLGGDHESAVGKLARSGGTALLLVVAATDSVSAAVEALQAGAHDCLARPLSVDDLSMRIAALRARHDRRGVLPPLTRTPAPGPGRIIAHSPQMQAILEQLNRMAGSPAPVFLSGEGGTGKRLAAETLHMLGPMAGHPFVAINCAMAASSAGKASSEDGLAQLVGTESAHAITKAGGGTVYLHEVGALGTAAQARLLQFVEPVGDAQPRHLPLRIVCSTRKSPADLLRDGTLRHDLFYRLNVLPIHLPPLRQRPEDVAPLATHFLRSFSRAAGKSMAGFTDSASAYLTAHEWPGNVRQLENMVRRVVSMFDAALITPQMLAAADIESQATRHRAAMAHLDDGEDILPMWQQEQRIIEAAIARFNGNIARAAAALEISPSTIYRKKQAWEDRENGGMAGAA